MGLAVAGCRFGATPTDPFFETTFVDASGPAGVGGHAADPGGAGTGGTMDGSAVGSILGSGGAPSNGAGGAGSAGESGGLVFSDGGALDATAPNACQPSAPPATCDPVHNVGCFFPFTFCDVDPTQPVPTGRCVFPLTSADASPACVSDVTSDTCLPSSTCVNGTCRRLCYCQGDCAAGQCCNEPFPASSGFFKLCAPC